MSSAAHHAAEQQEHHFPTASSAQSSDIHADPQQYGGKGERYDDDGILLESAEPSRQVPSSAQPAQSVQRRVDSSAHINVLPRLQDVVCSSLSASPVLQLMLHVEFFIIDWAKLKLSLQEMQITTRARAIAGESACSSPAHSSPCHIPMWPGN